MKNTKLRIILLFGFFLCTCFFFVNQTQAEEKWWDFEKWEVDIQINQDSTFIVRETQTVNFHGNFHWIQRDIVKQRLRAIEDIKVYNADGTRLTGNAVEISENSQQVNVKLNFDITNAQKTWVFEYTVYGGIGYFENWDELYWNVVSSDRDVLIKDVEVTVHLPEEIGAGQIKRELFVGYAGDKNISSKHEAVDGQIIRYWGQEIQPNQNFTIVAGWPKGAVYHPGIVKINSGNYSAQVVVDGKPTRFETPAVLESGYDITVGQHEVYVKKAGYVVEQEPKKILVAEDQTLEVNFVLTPAPWMRIVGWLLLLIPALILFLVVRTRRRAPKMKGTIIAQYEPPKIAPPHGNVRNKADHLKPAEMTALMKNFVSNRALTGTLIDLAYRGFLKIIEKEKKWWIFKSKDYTLEKTENYSKDDLLRDYESSFLSVLFGSGKSVRLADLKNRTSLPGKIRKIKKQAKDKLVDYKYFRVGKMKVWRSPFRILGWLVFFLGIYILNAYPFLLLGIAFLSSGLILIINSFLKPLYLTQEGTDAKWYALGFREYLQVAERFRLGACTPKTFEEFLSYAVIFGVEKKWADRFADIYKESPDWYQSSQPVSAFNTAAFTNSINSFSSVFSSSTMGASASSSSGFGGGGSSGGGSGGGGSSAG